MKLELINEETTIEYKYYKYNNNYIITIIFIIKQLNTNNNAKT